LYELEFGHVSITFGWLLETGKVIRAVLRIHNSNSQHIKELEVVIPLEFKYLCDTYKYAHDTMISKTLLGQKKKK
jgi:hypothetical protein